MAMSHFENDIPVSGLVMARMLETFERQLMEVIFRGLASSSVNPMTL